MHSQSKQTQTIIQRRFAGPLADELFLQCRPDLNCGMAIVHQTRSIYQALDALLRRENGSLSSLVHETVFFRNITRDFEKYQSARRQFFIAGCKNPPAMPAATYIEQPPLDTEADVVASAIAILPRGRSMEMLSHSEPASSRAFVLGRQKYLFAGNICGAPGNAFDQAYSMFSLANETLAKESMTFRNVVRTWIYLREMERDYGEFNRARTEFFRQYNVTLLPASTGIGGSPVAQDADFTLAFCAIRDLQHLVATAMTTPTLNEACSYGSDFSRGLRVAEANKVALYISGTASVDEQGRTAHVDEFVAQVERMLLNIETLLASQNGSFRNVLSAVTYLKRAADAPAFQQVLNDRNLADLPNVLIHAAVCRPDLLCEMEAIAALPII
jgi:enamine deaminase RidA (YjgF/YER057c/UK114 family)